MGLTKEQEKAREEDVNVRYLAQNICNKDGDKDYVFISYKSDDWEIVLKEIVYKLVKEYGLNVYFDGDFNDNNPHWTTQFPQNMESSKCKGVLVFLDDKYATSYATLMELMHSQFGCQDEDDNYNFIRKPVVVINLEDLSVINDVSDTGLGKSVYFNGEKEITNIKAPDEQELFDEDFDRGCDLKVIQKAKKQYKKEKKLPKKLCAVVVAEVLRSIDYSNNYYNGSLKGIVSSIKSVCGETVFHDKKEEIIYHVDITNKEEGLGVGSVFDPSLIKGVSEKNKGVTKIDENEPTSKGKGDAGVPGSKGVFYRIKSTDYNATCKKVDENQFILLKGSKVKINEKYISKKYLNYIETLENRSIVRENLVFDTPSGLANFITGNSVNGKTFFSDNKIISPDMINEDVMNEIEVKGESKATWNDDAETAVADTGCIDKGIISGPVSLNGSVSKPGKKGKKESLEEMMAKGKLSEGDEVYVKNNPDKVGFLGKNGEINYNGMSLSLNKYVSEVLGPGSRNAYIYVYHKKSQKLLDELRG